MEIPVFPRPRSNLLFSPPEYPLWFYLLFTNVTQKAINNFVPLEARRIVNLIFCAEIQLIWMRLSYAFAATCLRCFISIILALQLIIHHNVLYVDTGKRTWHLQCIFGLGQYQKFIRPEAAKCETERNWMNEEETKDLGEVLYRNTAMTGSADEDANAIAFRGESSEAHLLVGERVSVNWRVGEQILEGVPSIRLLNSQSISVPSPFAQTTTMTSCSTMTTNFVSLCLLRVSTQGSHLLTRCFSLFRRSDAQYNERCERNELPVSELFSLLYLFLKQKLRWQERTRNVASSPCVWIDVITRVFYPLSRFTCYLLNFKRKTSQNVAENC